MCELCPKDDAPETVDDMLAALGSRFRTSYPTTTASLADHLGQVMASYERNIDLWASYDETVYEAMLRFRADLAAHLDARAEAER